MFLTYIYMSFILLNRFDINTVDRTAVFENNYRESLYFLHGGV